MEKFSYEANGYNRKEVNQFVDDVIVQTQNIVKKCQAQSEEIEKVKKELAHYQAIEDSLKHAILSAEIAGDNVKKMAREEAAKIVEDAKNNANRVVNEALLKAEKIESNRLLLEKNMNIFTRKLKALVDQQMAVIDEIEELEIEP